MNTNGHLTLNSRDIDYLAKDCASSTVGMGRCLYNRTNHFLVRNLVVAENFLFGVLP
ncbi:hypothetical protein BOH78_1113 [Pichia kudriavzevii]|uniref:Uncharacterized protein n=1 Tax=Pichia kudriavzevii TaxID=4909 RepID=A0A1V2LRJ9_PICKU|nr:hypothetical protein BOH78_1113 [Pichia kudriavzevii]